MLFLFIALKRPFALKVNDLKMPILVAQQQVNETNEWTSLDFQRDFYFRANDFIIRVIAIEHIKELFAVLVIPRAHLGKREWRRHGLVIFRFISRTQLIKL